MSDVPFDDDDDDDDDDDEMMVVVLSQCGKTGYFLITVNA